MIASEEANSNNRYDDIIFFSRILMLVMNAVTSRSYFMYSFMKNYMLP